MQTEALKIIESIVQRMDFQLTPVARPGIHLPDRQAAPESTPRRTVEAVASSTTAASSAAGAAQ